jgi:hypothetical protein
MGSHAVGSFSFLDLIGEANRDYFARKEHRRPRSAVMGLKEDAYAERIIGTFRKQRSVVCMNGPASSSHLVFRIQKWSNEIATASNVLSEIDESAFIIHQRGHEKRPMPTFRAEEISVGKTLGMGGFGIVKEIVKFTLDPEPENGDTCRAGPSTLGIKAMSELSRTEVENPQQAKHRHRDDDDETLDSSSIDNNTRKNDNHLQGSMRQPEHDARDSNNDHHDDHYHYDVATARHCMQRRCLRHGTTARYAIKRLHGCLSAAERARGMLDLAVEAKYLSVVWHPNISK